MVVLEDYERKNFELKTIGASVQRSGIYIFLISFSCLYYLSNAEIMLGHYDLRAGPGCLNRIPVSISGASAGVKPPSGLAAG